MIPSGAAAVQGESSDDGNGGEGGMTNLRLCITAERTPSVATAATSGDGSVRCRRLYIAAAILTVLPGPIYLNKIR